MSVSFQSGASFPELMSFGCRSELAALHPHLSIRRAVLARALEDIFPITPTMHHRTILFSILSIALPIPTQPKDPAPPLHLPASELPPGTHLDEESVATALGYVAMVVQVLAAQLGRVLPYPLTCSGSRSAVKDPISVMQGPTRVSVFCLTSQSLLLG